MRPQTIRTEPTALQEIAGAIMIVGAVFFCSMSGIFLILGGIGEGIKKLFGGNNVR